MNVILSPDPALFKRKYLLYDTFASALAAGAVNGSRADAPSDVEIVGAPATRTVVDTNGKISVGSSLLNFATGAAANDGVWYPSIARAAGRTLIWRVTPADTSGILNVGWDNNASGALLDCLQFAAAGVLNIVANGGTAFAVGAYTATTYDVAAVMRATGIKWFIKGGAFTYWTKLPTTILGTAAGLPAIGVGSATTVATATKPRSQVATWLDTPLVSDSFAGTRTGLGSTDGAGHAEGNGGSGVAWQHDAGAWAVSGGVAVGTPTVGAELWDAPAAAFTSGTYAWVGYGTNVIANDNNELKITYGNTANGAYEFFSDAADLSANLVIGRWYSFSCKSRVSVGGSAGLVISSTSAISLPTQTSTVLATQSATFRANSTTGDYVRCSGLDAGESIWLDDLSLLPLILSSLISVTPTTTADVVTEVALTAYTTGTQAGLCVRCDSQSSPANFILADQSGGSVIITECVGGVYATLGTYTSAYAAGDVLRIWLSGAAWRLYKITAAGAATLLGSGTTNVTTGLLHGLFNTSPSLNTFDNYHCWATGTGNEHGGLDAM